MIFVFRVFSVLFAILTYADTLDSSPNLGRIVGRGLIAVTFATLSLGRPLLPTPPGRLQRLDERVWGAVKPRRFKP